MSSSSIKRWKSVYSAIMRRSDFNSTNCRLCKISINNSNIFYIRINITGIILNICSNCVCTCRVYNRICCRNSSTGKRFKFKVSVFSYRRKDICINSIIRENMFRICCLIKCCVSCISSSFFKIMSYISGSITFDSYPVFYKFASIYFSIIYKRTSNTKLEINFITACHLIIIRYWIWIINI